MAKYQWDFSIENKATADRDGIVIVHDGKTGTAGHFALSGHTGDGEWGDCVYEQSGFRAHDAEVFLSTMGWI